MAGNLLYPFVCSSVSSTTCKVAVESTVCDTSTVTSTSDCEFTVSKLVLFSVSHKAHTTCNVIIYLPENCYSDSADKSATNPTMDNYHRWQCNEYYTCKAAVESAVYDTTNPTTMATTHSWQFSNAYCTWKAEVETAVCNTTSTSNCKFAQFQVNFFSMSHSLYIFIIYLLDQCPSDSTANPATISPAQHSRVFNTSSKECNRNAWCRIHGVFPDLRDS